MIRYDLRCDKGHDFDGWFRDSEGFEILRKAGQVACTHCGSVVVDKALMAPRVAAPRDDRPKPDLRTPRDPREAALERLRRHVEENSDYVGMSFAAEARAMHEGLAPERAIHGEAKPEEARKLIEDGIPVAPLPFRTRERAN
ncbi:DUF1178 domain-containing protein [Paracoccus mutanolyticus]|uniref:DUF1178 domain-containing protein n=1 Tax=Paracoccus mutanolyticus TaxID=1499308 RepID=A0ABM6WRP3_9RHOB|nr:DUF1178 family protein [Paracoccus mutanolyticus]AWX93334.1 DUF1178 domain-containing protein [Paracoccus mutanolyticus]